MKTLVLCLCLAVCACGGSEPAAAPQADGAVDGRALQVAHDMCQAHGGVTGAQATERGGVPVAVNATCTDGSEVSVPLAGAG